MSLLPWVTAIALCCGMVLGMTLAKTPEEEAIFLQCFDRFFDRQLADFSEEQQPDEQSAVDDNEADTASTPDQDSSVSDTTSESSPLEEAAQSDPSLEELMQSELMQALVNNDSQRSQLGHDQSGRGRPACNRFRCSPRRDSSPGKFWMRWVKNRSASLSSSWSAPTVPHYPSFSAIETYC